MHSGLQVGVLYDVLVSILDAPNRLDQISVLRGQALEGGHMGRNFTSISLFG